MRWKDTTEWKYLDLLPMCSFSVFLQGTGLSPALGSSGTHSLAPAMHRGQLDLATNSFLLTPFCNILCQVSLMRCFPRNNFHLHSGEQISGKFTPVTSLPFSESQLCFLHKISIEGPCEYFGRWVSFPGCSVSD